MPQREVISVHVGHAGIKVGSKFWKEARSEHSIDQYGNSNAESDLQLYYSSVFFEETDRGKYVPRSLFIDLDPGTNEYMKNDPIANCIQERNFISGYTSAQNIFARGYFTDGNEILPKIEDSLTKTLENCDSFQGFTFFCSLGGGCGSGLSSLMMSSIRDATPGKLLHVVPIIPSPTVSDIVVEPYNTLLALHHISNDADLSICIDNEALFRMCHQSLHVQHPTLNDLNCLISQSILGLTASMRFPGQLNGDLNKISSTLIPYPRLMFALTSFAPLTKRRMFNYRPYSPRDLLTQNYSSSNWMAACPMERGTYLSSVVVHRGKACTHDIESTIKEIAEEINIKSSNCVPDNISLSFCDIPQRGFPSSSTVLANNTAVQHLFKRVCEQYSAMFRRSCFLHWYYGDGMEEEDFTNAEQNIFEIIEEYAGYETEVDMNEITEKFDLERKGLPKQENINDFQQNNISIDTPAANLFNTNESNAKNKLEMQVYDDNTWQESTSIRRFCFTNNQDKPQSSSAKRVQKKRCLQIETY